MLPKIYQWFQVRWMHCSWKIQDDLKSSREVGTSRKTWKFGCICLFSFLPETPRKKMVKRFFSQASTQTNRNKEEAIAVEAAEKTCEGEVIRQTQGSKWSSREVPDASHRHLIVGRTGSPTLGGKAKGKLKTGRWVGSQLQQRSKPIPDSHRHLPCHTLAEYARGKTQGVWAGEYGHSWGLGWVTKREELKEHLYWQSKRWDFFSPFVQLSF